MKDQMTLSIPEFIANKEGMETDISKCCEQWSISKAIMGPEGDLKPVSLLQPVYMWKGRARETLGRR